VRLRALNGVAELMDHLCEVEYTPMAYNPSDLDMFATNFSTGLVGKRPKLVSIDGGRSARVMYN
jgi:hypothetical protein